MRVFSVEAEARRRQIEKITQSPTFHGSESLCHLLKYLAEQSTTHPGVPIKEHQIAMDVFKRPADFDPRLDSSVRVQAGRLRAKLSDYYTTVGSQDEVVVELPRGSYALLFVPKAAAGTSVETPRVPEPAMTPVVAPAGPSGGSIPPPSPPAERGGWQRWWLGVLAGLLLGGVGAWFLLGRTGNPAPAPPAELRTLWNGFVDTREAPLVVYSNAEFIGRPETGLRYFDPQRDASQKAFDHYTGVGEVQAVYELSHMFSRFGMALRVKRGRLLSWDDAKASDVVFIGSPSENLSLRDLPTNRRFSFERETVGDRKGDLMLVDRTPEPGSPSKYHASAGLPVLEDYAFLELAPGLVPGRWVMVLAGVSTFGTQAAVEFVCRPASVRQLLERLQVAPGAEVPPFEAVLRVKISGGVPVQSELVKVKRGR